jgi:hypothetical protein
MSADFFTGCCNCLIGASLITMMLVDSQPNRQIANCIQTLALSINFLAVKIFITNQPISFRYFSAIMLIPMAISLLISAQNFTKWLNIIRVISSVATIILLAPQAERNIPYFFLAAIVVGVNLLQCIRHPNQPYLPIFAENS